MKSPEVKSQPILTLRAMSGSMTKQQQGSVSMSMTHVTIKVHVDVPGLDCSLRPCRYPRAAQNWPCPSPTESLGRVGPAPCLGSTAELALVMCVMSHTESVEELPMALGELTVLESSPWW